MISHEYKPHRQPLDAAHRGLAKKTFTTHVWEPKLYDHSFPEALSRTGIRDLAVPMVASALRAGDPISVAYLDLDRFKQVNDILGHSAGDDIIRTAITILKTELSRESDLIGRHGGDEFEVVAANTTRRILSAKLREARIAFENKTKTLGVDPSISFGTADIRERLAEVFDPRLASTEGKVHSRRSSSMDLDPAIALQQARELAEARMRANKFERKGAR